MVNAVNYRISAMGDYLIFHHLGWVLIWAGRLIGHWTLTVMKIIKNQFYHDTTYFFFQTNLMSKKNAVKNKKLHNFYNFFIFVSVTFI